MASDHDGASDADAPSDDEESALSPREQQLLEHLLRYEEKLTSGSTCEDAAETSTGLAPDVAKELKDSQALLKQLYCHYDESPAVDTDQVISNDYQSLVASLEAAFDSSVEDGSATVRRIGRFQIVRELGRGGHGVVFLAFDPVLRRHVALKVPRPELVLAPNLRRRFVREAQAAARLTHPNLVPVYESGEIGPIWYIAAVYCPGQTLADWLSTRTSAVPPRTAARIVEQLALGMHYAHVQGILHRDIKPGNVLMEAAPTDEAAMSAIADNLEFVPRLTDFGLAKLTEGDGNATRTHTGTVLGTPTYMAPEQANGRLDEIGRHTDVYALGALFYELLTLRPIFRGSTDLDTLRQLVSEEPIAPRKLRRDVPADLEAIALKCVEKQPARRYRGCEELAADLTRFLHDEPTQARPLSPQQKLLKWSRRRPAVAGLVVVSVLASLLIVVGSSLYSVWLGQALSVSEGRRLEADEMRLRAEMSERDLREHSYSSDVMLAYEAWNRGDARTAYDMLVRHLPMEGKPDQRGFAWRLLRERFRGSTREFRGHEGDVYFVTISPDGRTVATAGKDKTVRTWDAATGEPKVVLVGHTDEVACVQFSPDSHSLASASDDRTVRIWDATTGQDTQVLRDHALQVRAVAFSPDGHTLASASDDCTTILWDTTNWKVLGTLVGNKLPVLAIAFCPQNPQVVATGSEDGTVKLWSTDGFKELHTLVGHHGAVSCVAFSSDGTHLASGSVDRTVKIWNASTWREVATLVGHTGKIQQVAYCPNASTLLSCSDDGTARLWGFDGKMLHAFVGGHGRVWSVATSPDGQTLATASSNALWKTWSLNEEPKILGEGYGEATAAFRPNGNAFAMASRNENGRVIVWDTKTRSRVKVLPPFPRAATSIAFSPSSKTLAVACEDDVIYELDATTWEPRREMYWMAHTVQSIVYSQNGRYLAIAERDGTVRVRDSATGEEAGKMQPQQAEAGIEPVRMAFSPNGRDLLINVLDHSRSAEIWDLSTFRHRATLSEDFPLDSSVFFPNGRSLATAAQGTIRFLNAHTLSHDRSLEGNPHFGTPARVAISADGAILVTGDSQGTLKLWDAASRRQVATFVSSSGEIDWIAISPDGEAMAVAGLPRGAVRLWSFSPLVDVAMDIWPRGD